VEFRVQQDAKRIAGRGAYSLLHPTPPETHTHAEATPTKMETTSTPHRQRPIKPKAKKEANSFHMQLHTNQKHAPKLHDPRTRQQVGNHEDATQTLPTVSAEHRRGGAGAAVRRLPRSVETSPQAMPTANQGPSKARGQPIPPEENSCTWVTHCTSKKNHPRGMAKVMLTTPARPFRVVPARRLLHAYG
jgi:hypothetical protein